MSKTGFISHVILFLTKEEVSKMHWFLFVSSWITFCCLQWLLVVVQKRFLAPLVPRFWPTMVTTLANHSQAASQRPQVGGGGAVGVGYLDFFTSCPRR